VNASFDRVLSDWVMCSIWREDRDCERLVVAHTSYFASLNILALPFGRASIAALYASGSVFPSLGNSSNETSRPLYASDMFFCRCSPMHHEYPRPISSRAPNSRIAGNLPPETPTMDSFPTFPRLRRSNRVSPTTPTFLSDFDAPPPTNPVVYSPVPT
jgi:hypothetical protein